ncbi:uncharacterized protein LOC114293538 [Camellia sinensis]|uniref:uncharacterized protein LOC114293538 n=1 Tax=Camellia sinensis TaxID=4442 RepID=UPI00103695D9|nr:uncharacterized protein LOC114293538 [Camellia sinensis]
MSPEVVQKENEEIARLLKIGFIRTARYVEWLSNIVPVIKKNDKLRVCIDFRNLNLTTLRDEYPLHIVDLLVDNLAGHGILSMMDGHSSYNQIYIVKEDVRKIAFRLYGRASRPSDSSLQKNEEIQAKSSIYSSVLLVYQLETSWAEHQAAFEGIKAYLAKPPVLMPPRKGKPLKLYIATAEESLGVFLAQDDEEGKEQAVYYLSRFSNS